jgi:pilus assembly protein CpaE
VIAFYAPKGGSGRTTIALNLAAQLAKGDPGDVLLMDLDFPHNQAALLSGLVPTGSLARARRASQGEGLEDTLLSGAELHNAGYMVLAGALRAEEAELVDSELVTQAIRTLRRSFGHLVVDLGASLSEVALSVFDLAERVVVVITPELPSLRGAQDVLRILHDVLHVPDERITLVLNHRQANAVVPREAVERTLGRRPDLEIAHDGNRSERAALDGTVVAVSDPKSEMAKATRTLAGRLKRPEEDSQ